MLPTNPNLYADEETDRLFDYPPHFRFMQIAAQLSAMQSCLGIEPATTNEWRWALPEGAEGWVAAPRLRALTATHPNKNLAPALEAVLRMLSRSPSWSNRGVRIENNLQHGLLRTTPRHAGAMRDTRMLSSALHMFPAQLGKRFGRKTVSPRRAEVLFAENEFGLDPVTALVLVVTHWDSLRGATLRIDCTGAEYAPSGDPNACTDTPRIDIAHGAIALDWNWNQRARGFHGPASGWTV